MAIIAPSNFRDEELLYTKEELERAGIKTTIASTKTGEIGSIITANGPAVAHEFGRTMAKELVK